jgi:hypothetical protein
MVVGFSPEDPPNRVKEVLRETGLAIAGVLGDPGPKVETLAYEPDRILYETKLSLTDLFATRRIRDEFATRLWYAARRAGLTLAHPTRALHGDARRASGDEAERSMDELGRVPAFAALEPSSLAALGRAATRLPYARGESLLREGAVPGAVCALASGSASLLVAGRDGGERVVLELGPGDLLGEEAFVGAQPSAASVVATADSIAIAIPAPEARALLDRSAPVARSVAELIEARAKAIERVRSAAPGA